MSDKILENSIRYLPDQDYEGYTSLGIALSGGGSRAIAFHLGCFRALNDLELLGEIDHISSVSGGSLFSALYCYFDEPFESFDERVTKVLSDGLQAKIASKLFLSPLVFKVLWTNVIAGTAANISRLFGGSPPLKRWFSRTSAFVEVLEEELFSGLDLTSKRKNDIDVIINACELSTGSAFRFGSKESGSWRIGKIENNNVRLSEAVASSAAYPLFLPALDKEYMFLKEDEIERKRVYLTDGGVYDNTGVTCFYPGKSSEFSYNVYKPSCIFAFDAGHGIYGKPSNPFYLKSRVEKAYSTTFRKRQDSIKGKIHNLLASGKIDGFIFSHLGQNDSALPYQPAEFITNEQVVGYPTDFKSMSKEDIELISGRGEQLTRLLISHYSPSI